MDRPARSRVVSPNFLRICSNSPLNPPRDSSSRGAVSTSRRDAVGLGAGIGLKAQRRAGVAVEAPADADAEEHQHRRRRDAHAPAAAPPPALAGFLRSGSWTGALLVCRSSTSDCSSPSVVAVVAALTRSPCSAIDSWPSLSALSRIWHVSLRSLSFARVPAVCLVATTEIVGVGTSVAQVSRRPDAQPADVAVPSRLGGHVADVLWSPCDCSDKWWTMRFGAGPCWPRSTRDAPASRRSATPIPICCGPRSSMGSPVR